MEIPKSHAPWVRSMYFWIGIIATTAYRLVVFFNGYDQKMLQTVWYVGTIGFIIYFAHRASISKKRATIIQDFELDTKINQSNDFSSQDKAALSYVLRTLKSSKEKWNYVYIFIASGVALAWGIYVDFIKNAL